MKSLQIALLTCLSLVFFLACAAGERAGTKESPPPGDTEVAAPVSVVKPEREARWDKVLVAARQEGRVVVYSQAAGGLRADLIKNFREKFGIDLEMTAGRGEELLVKIEAERRAGLRVADVLVQGVGALVQFKTAGLVDDIQPALIHPEATDPKAWLGGGIYFVDKERKMISFLTHAGSTLIINTDMVKPEEIKSYRDLLNPKWKGKMVMDNPTVTGAGSSFYAFNMMEIMGPEMAGQLLKQDLRIISDQRQLVEWVARGTYPIGLAPRPEVFQEFLRAGAPLKFIIPAEGTYATGGFGGMILIREMPHPNAATVFINWLLTREGQTIMVKGAGDQSRRLDVTKQYIDEDRQVKEGVKYLETENEEMTLKRIERMRQAKEVFAPLLK
ncbi:MAG: extracellular solute-binding protein [Chloroflexi bacterium]|nr:extracellular solute-binding protein [Chloroflexota bacterium]